MDEDDDEDDEDLEYVDGVVFFDAGPLLTPGLRPVCNFLLYAEDEEDEDDSDPCVIFEDFDDEDLFDLFEVLLMVNFKPSCDDLTIYSLLLLLPLPPLVLRQSEVADVVDMDDFIPNSLLPGICICVGCCLWCLSSGSCNPSCNGCDRIEAVDTVAVVGVDVIKLT